MTLIILKLFPNILMIDVLIYFRIENCTLKFQQLDCFVRYRLEPWVRAKLGSRGYWNVLAFRGLMTEHGLDYFYLTGAGVVKP